MMTSLKQLLLNYRILALLFMPAYTLIATEPVVQPTDLAPGEAATYAVKLEKTPGPRVLQIGLWAGINKSLVKSDYNSAMENSGLTAKSNDALFPAFGAMLWYGSEKWQIGFSANWYSVYNYIGTGSAASTTTYSETFRLLSGQGHIRYFLLHGLYASLGIGSGLSLITADSGLGSTSTAQGVFLGSVRIGYDIKHMYNPRLIIGFFVEPTFVFQSLRQSIAGAAASTYNGNTLNLLVGFSLGYRMGDE